MTPPDVLYRHRDGLYDATATAWDAHQLQPLAPEPDPKARPLVHRAGCRMAPWPDLAAVCPCTADQRYTRRRLDIT
ncbi:hypothetical protein [Actinacidiphila sp. ITFR-21]|uniref:hypothetical protein n=1 Tax=Actinacidiphila sp. ITFR-21 TaxID=3075199 RepID=UPI00288AD0C2|nr:hypothetical protein [Streptomyces sp. ITFR-21]WNI19128.1 hypothetical protein RLT57_28730 [Streptomyces sp. ITFR-21]